MSRFDFMMELESLLSDIPIDERNDALKYYNDYFDDAGEENEEAVVEELGSPERVAGIIKADLYLNEIDSEKRGIFTELGYQDTVYPDEKFEIVNAAKKAGNEKEKDTSTDQRKVTGTGYDYDTVTESSSGNAGTGYHNGSAGTGYSSESTGSGYNTGSTGTGYNSDNTGTGYNSPNGSNQRQQNPSNIILILVLCIFASPFIFSALGIVFSVIATIFALFIGFGIAGAVMVAAGLGIFFAGLVQFSVPFIGFAFCGSGLFVFGLGILFVLFSATLCRKVLPSLIRGIVNLCRLPFKNRRVSA